MVYCICVCVCVLMLACVIVISSPNDLKDVEKAALNLLRLENTDIKQKQDPVRYIFFMLYTFSVHLLQWLLVAVSVVKCLSTCVLVTVGCQYKGVKCLL